MMTRYGLFVCTSANNAEAGYGRSYIERDKVAVSQARRGGEKAGGGETMCWLAVYLWPVKAS